MVRVHIRAESYDLKKGKNVLMKTEGILVDRTTRIVRPFW